MWRHGGSPFLYPGEGRERVSARRGEAARRAGGPRMVPPCGGMEVPPFCTRARYRGCPRGRARPRGVGWEVRLGVAREGMAGGGDACYLLKAKRERRRGVCFTARVPSPFRPVESLARRQDGNGNATRASLHTTPPP